MEIYNLLSWFSWLGW